jgi:hypothetical protein
VNSTNTSKLKYFFSKKNKTVIKTIELEFTTLLSKDISTKRTNTSCPQLLKPRYATCGPDFSNWEDEATILRAFFF